MDDSVSITIQISDKAFSLKVSSPEDAALLKNAAQKLNERIMQRSTHSMISKEDILSMVAFDLMVAALKEEERCAALADQLERVSSLIDEELTDK